MTETNIIEKRIEEWKSRLIDLTKSNRLLYFRKTKRSTLEIYRPDIKIIFKRLFLQEKPWKFWIPPQDDSEQNQKMTIENISQMEKLHKLLQKNKPEKDELVCKNPDKRELELALKNIYRRAKTEEQERGIKILYITFGSLKWREQENADISYAPLLLFPVELHRESTLEPFVLNLTEDDVFLNPALKVKLQRDFNFELPDYPEEWDEDNLEIYLNSVAQKVKFLNWSLEKDCFIGIFSFHKLSMYNDLSNNASYIKKHPILCSLGMGDSVANKFFSEITDERKLDTIQKPEDTFQILDADSSQQQSIQSALQGKSFVLQGPPGTGKSQTIANIITEFIARGKTTLFVSEKMAALEVVFKRLYENSLGDFCLELHSHKAKKREVINELKRCLDESIEVKDKISEEDFEKLKNLRQKLNDYVLALHMIRKPLNKSVYEVISNVINLDVPLINFEVDTKELKPETLSKWEALIAQLALNWKVVEDGENFPWLGNKETDFTPIMAEEWKRRLKNLASLIEKLEIEGKAVSERLDIKTPGDLEDFKWLLQVGEHISQTNIPEEKWLKSHKINELIVTADKFNKFNFDYWEIKRNLEQDYEKDFFKLPSDLGKRIKEKWEIILKLIKMSDNNQKLFLNRNEVLEFLENTLKISTIYLEYINTFISTVAFPKGNLSINRMKEICEISLLSSSSIKIESIWFEPDCLEKVKGLINEIEPQYKSYNNRKNTLLINYDESFLELELDILIEKFSSFFYTSPIRCLNPWFYKAKKLILRTARKPGLLPSVLDDLCEARELNRMDKKLESKSEQIKRLFGKYDRGYDTDFQSLKEALEVVSQIIKLTDIIPVPKELISLILDDKTASSDIFKTGKEFMDFLKLWEKEYEEISKIVPLENLTEENKPFRERDIVSIKKRFEEISPFLQDFIKLIEQVICFVKNKSTVDIYKVISDLEKKERFEEIQSLLKEDNQRYISNFGKNYLGVNTNWIDIIERLKWVQGLHKLFGDKLVSEKVINISLKKEELPDLSEMINTYKEIIKQIDEIESFFEKPAPLFQGVPFRKLSIKKLWDRTLFLLEQRDSLHIWINFKKTEQSLKEAKLSLFLDEVKRVRQESSQLVRMFRKAIYLKWIENVFLEDHRLGTFTGINHERLINEFREIDRKLISYTPERVINSCDSRKPQDYIKSQDTEIGILKREAAKKRKHMPVRHLFKKIPDLLLKLKPCLLMSPLSVSQYLHPEVFKFDLIIFDEASQIFTEDAVGAILRGSQIVIAGDRKQLPPTNFFRASEGDDDTYDEEDDEQSSANYESVLDECSVILPIIPNPFLKWHYRSRHESLIAFSNCNFYQNKLVTFPSAEFNGKDCGVNFIHVPDGIYDRGGKRNNIQEAIKVVETVFEHFKLYPEKSLGVVAFSQTQMETIDDEIELYLKKYPEFKDFFKEHRLEGFFVKNLENVQGDERDVIIFSIGYGRDKDGRIMMNFGPINKPGGEKRLNVAVTRAREKVVVISSIKAVDIDLKRTSAEGVRQLYYYLDYAERGESALNLRTSFQEGESESPFETSVANEVKNLGYNVVHQVGCSGYRIDIGVIDPSQPGRFLLGVECDGATYHSAATARDRDRLRQEILENLGWNIYRIWSPDWMNKKDGEIRRLKEALEKAKKSPIKINKELNLTAKKKR